MDFIGNDPIEVSLFIDRLYAIEEKNKFRKKWQNFASEKLKKNQHIVLIASQQRSSIFQESLYRIRIIRLRHFIKRWNLKSKWKHFYRLLLRKFYKVSAIEYYRLLGKQKTSVRQQKWQKMARKYTNKKKLLLKGDSYKELLEYRQIRDCFYLWGKNVLQKRDKERAKWVSFMKRIMRINKNRTLRKLEYHEAILNNWKYLSSKITQIYNRDEIEAAYFHDLYLQKWLRFSQMLQRKAFKAIFSKPLTTKPKWISMIKRISRIKTRKLIMKRQREFVERTIWRDIYDRITKRNKQKIIKEGLKEITKIHQEEKILSTKKKYMSKWFVLSKRKQNTRKIINNIYLEAYKEYKTSQMNQSAAMIQNLFRGKKLIQERNIWRKKVKLLFYRWKSSLLYIQAFRNAIPPLVQEYEFPTYSLEFEEIHTFSPDQIISTIYHFGDVCYNYIDYERKRKEQKQIDEQIQSIASQTIEILDIDSIFNSLVHISILPNFTHPIKPKNKSTKQTDIDIANNAAFNNYVSNVFSETIEQIDTKPNLSSINNFVPIPKEKDTNNIPKINNENVIEEINENNSKNNNTKLFNDFFEEILSETIHSINTKPNLSQINNFVPKMNMKDHYFVEDNDEIHDNIETNNQQVDNQVDEKENQENDQNIEKNKEESNHKIEDNVDIESSQFADIINSHIGIDDVLSGICKINLNPINNFRNHNTDNNLIDQDAIHNIGIAICNFENPLPVFDLSPLNNFIAICTVK